VSCGGALTHFFCKLGLKKICFTALGGAGAPTAPPGYAYVFWLIFISISCGILSWLLWAFDCTSYVHIGCMQAGKECASCSSQSI